MDEYDLYDKVHAENPTVPKPLPIHAHSRTKTSNNNKSILLTAKSLDSHSTNGRTDWCLVDCGCDMYRTLVKSSGRPSKSVLDSGEPIFFDFQPLSTRLSLMTKFIVIAQGGTAGSPANYIQVYDSSTTTSSSSSSTTTTSRSKSFDSHLAGNNTNNSQQKRESIPRRGIVMPNSGLYVKIWANDEFKVSVFGSDPFSRMNKSSCESCRLVPAKNMRPAVVRSSKISQLMSNFEQPPSASSKPQPHTTNPPNRPGRIDLNKFQLMIIFYLGQ